MRILTLRELNWIGLGDKLPSNLLTRMRIFLCWTEEFLAHYAQNADDVDKTINIIYRLASEARTGARIFNFVWEFPNSNFDARCLFNIDIESGIVQLDFQYYRKSLFQRGVVLKELLDYYNRCVECAISLEEKFGTAE